MAKIPVWKGSKEITETPDSPEIDYDSSSMSVRLTFEGPYEKMRAKPPVIGQLMPGYSGIYVEGVALKKARGGKGIMTITMKSVSGDPGYPTPIFPTFEFEWSQLERPIEQAPCFLPGGAYPLTEKDLDDLHTWENADGADRATKYAALTASAKRLALKKKRGETTIMLFAPVVKITQEARNVTSSPVACGFVYTVLPGFPALPDGYKFLLSADRSTRVGEFGKWQNTREYLGAQFWDSDLYPLA